MQSASQAIFAEWSPPPILTSLIVLTALIYARGWYLLRKTRPAQFATWRLLLFCCGLATLWIAIASPLDGFADALLSAHMVEHLLLMSFAPPLILLSLPVVPLLRGLPRAFTRTIIGPLIRLRALRKLGHWLITPMVAWLAMNLTFVGWHIPAAYDFAPSNMRPGMTSNICVFWVRRYSSGGRWYGPGRRVAEVSAGLFCPTWCWQIS